MHLHSNGVPHVAAASNYDGAGLLTAASLVPLAIFAFFVTLAFALGCYFGWRLRSQHEEWEQVLAMHRPLPGVAPVQLSDASDDAPSSDTSNVTVHYDDILISDEYEPWYTAAGRLREPHERQMRCPNCGYGPTRCRRQEACFDADAFLDGTTQYVNVIASDGGEEFLAVLNPTLQRTGDRRRAHPRAAQ